MFMFLLFDSLLLIAAYLALRCKGFGTSAAAIRPARPTRPGGILDNYWVQSDRLRFFHRISKCYCASPSSFLSSTFIRKPRSIQTVAFPMGIGRENMHRLKERYSSARKSILVLGEMQANDLSNDDFDDESAPEPHGISGGARYRRVVRVQGKGPNDSGAKKGREVKTPRGGPPEASVVRSRMHIMGGSHRGRSLLAPSSEVYIRPMMSRVKAALFSTLSHFSSIKGSRFLDLFCGVGSVGIEALSRGAASTTFVDNSPRCSEVVRMNLQSCKFSTTENPVICANAFDVLRSNSSCIPQDQIDVLTATPPYEEISYQELLNTIATSALLRSGGIAVVEYPVELGSLPFAPSGGALLGLRNRRYGRTVLAIYAKSPGSDAARPLGPSEMEYRPEEFSNGPLSH